MKKATQQYKAAPRLLSASRLEKVRGGITADDNWEPREYPTPTTKVWTDDWLAPV